MSWHGPFGTVSVTAVPALSISRNVQGRLNTPLAAAPDRSGSGAIGVVFGGTDALHRHSRPGRQRAS
jgi:hypothetical protein